MVSLSLPGLALNFDSPASASSVAGIITGLCYPAGLGICFLYVLFLYLKKYKILVFQNEFRKATMPVNRINMLGLQGEHKFDNLGFRRG